MCGFAGFWDEQARVNKAELESRALSMANTLRHRGPDSYGVWAQAEAGLAFGHRRLAILDLSPAGHQPMCSPSGRFVLVYNGEVYNCAELRSELLRENGTLSFRGHSDTEVMLAAFEAWGLDPALKRMNGMFAFALWDRQRRELFLARDRMGEKPLYYGWVKNVFLFGSELKALRAYPTFDAEIDRDALASYLRFDCVPAPFSIYKNISKLQPGCFLRLRKGNLHIREYWSLRSSVMRGLSEPFPGCVQEAEEELDGLLRDAVKLRMHADVPLGAFLSGGIDSSLVVALMQAQSSEGVRTFSIGFHDEECDEAKDAQRVARHLGTDHTELYVTSADAMRMIDSLPEIYDEPFADSSQIPTLLVSELARRQVTVSLSGDGGDEIFGGYNRYTWGDRVWRYFERATPTARRLAASAIRAAGPRYWDAAFRLARPVLPKAWRQRLPGYKLHKIATLLTSADPEEMYARMASRWFEPERALRGARKLAPLAMVDHQQLALSDFAQQAMYLDALTFLPNDILVKVDRATMAFSLEGRIPYLDHRVVEFAWRLPVQLKVRPNQGKWILRQVLYRYVPGKLIERPKMGFGIPLDLWLRGPLRDWAEALLEPQLLEQAGFFNAPVVRQIWKEHLSGRGAWHYHIWDVLMFQLWLRHQNSELAGRREAESIEVVV